MWKIAAGAGALFALAALSACETMSPEECQIADWRAVGYTDGTNGQMRYDSHQRTCAKVGIAPNFDDYVAGRAEGLRRFCVPEAGFRRALSGSSYENQCPADLAAAYIDAHTAGRRAYDVTSALQNARSRLSSLDYERRELDRDIEKAEHELADTKLSDERRKEIRADIQRMDRDRRRINDDIITAERTLRLYETDVDRVRYEIGDRWGAW